MLNTIIAKTLMELGEVSIIKKETPEGVSIIRLIYLSVNHYPTVGAVRATSLVSADARSSGKL